MNNKNNQPRKLQLNKKTIINLTGVSQNVLAGNTSLATITPIITLLLSTICIIDA
jgi:hypothetical protein